MNKIFYLLFFLIIGTTYTISQEKRIFIAENHSFDKNYIELNNLFSNFSVFEMPIELINECLINKNYEFILKLDNDLTFDLSLSPHKITSNNYVLSSKNSHHHQNIKTSTYNGIANNTLSSKVALSIRKNHFSGLIIIDSITYCFEPLNKYIKNVNPNLVLTYKLKDINNEIQLSCSEIKPTEVLTNLNLFKTKNSLINKTLVDSCKTIQMAIAVDNDMFVKFSNDTMLLQQEIIDLLNFLTPLFSNPPLEIEIQLVEVYIASPNEIVPDSELDFGVILSSFAYFGIINFTNPFSAATLWITRDAHLSGNYGTAGTAYQNGACYNFNKYLVIEHLTPGLITQDHQAKLWAHEIGHLLNALHSPQVNSNIMAPLVSNTANTWTSDNINAILTKKTNSNCLVPCHVSAGFNIDNSIICEGDFVAYTDTSYGEPNTFNWSFPGGTPNVSNDQNPVIQYNTPGDYSATLVISNSTDTDTIIMTNLIKVNPLPIVNFDLNTICCLSTPQFNIDFGNPSGGTYVGDGINLTLFSPNIAGIGTHIINYIYTDSNSCMNADTTTITVENCTASLNSNDYFNDFIIYPNPTNSIIYIKSNDNINTFKIYNLIGQDVTELTSQTQINNYTIAIDLNHLSPGLYLIESQTHAKIINKY